MAVAPIEVKSYTPLTSQRLFHESNAYLRLYQGGFGAGKTLAGVWEALDVSLAYPRNFGLIARKTYRELEDSTKKTFFDICPPQLIKQYKARDDAVTLVNDSVILFRSLDDPNKFRSINLGWFYIDEASEIDDEDVPTMLTGRLRLANVPWRGGWFTSNPSHVEHWMYKWFVERRAGAPERYFMVTATSYDNPHLPLEYIKMLEEEYSPQWAKRYLLGEFGFIIPGTPVYTHFNYDLHVAPEIEWLKDRPVFRAWDFGFHHPAVLFSQVGPDRQWLILKELMGSRTLLHKFAEEVVMLSNTMFPGSSFIDVGDPAGHQHGDKDERTSIDLLKDQFGIRLVTRRQPKKRLIELIDQQFQRVRKDRDGVRPMVQVSKAGCPITIDGLNGGYAWPKAKDGRIYRESPIEDGFFEHLMDCAQYTAGAIFLGGALGGKLNILEPRWSFS